MTCSLCDRPAHCHGWCRTHYTRWRRHGSPHTVLKRGSTATGPGNPNWRGDAVSYYAVHQRIKSVRGKAADQWCSEYRCPNPAAQWSYDHTDPDERVDPHPYSLDLMRYRPLCRNHHAMFDHTHCRMQRATT